MKRMMVKLSQRLLGGVQAWPNHSFETVWVDELPSPPHHYRVENTPFFATEFSYQDIVEAVEQTDGDLLEYSRVVSRSGHSTVRAILRDEEGSEQADAAIVEAEKLGCAWESSDCIVALDVPPTTDVTRVRVLLSNARDEGAIFVDEGYVSHVNGLDDPEN